MPSKNNATLRALLRAGASMTAFAIAASGAFGVAAAQDSQGASATAAAKPDDTVVVVHGFRAALQTSLQQKRKADVELDAINADDIASFPDANLAESLQRIPGISITRDNGEGRNISVRGLAPDFSRVRIDGMEALSTAGANDSGTSANRTRAFDFNTFASELFQNLSVRKTADAQTDEGSLGATVDLRTARPFDFKGNKFAFSAEDAYYENGRHNDPRYTALVSRRWDDGKLGFLGSAAYQVRDTSISNYQRGPGQSDYVFRSADYKGNENPERGGFAAPAGTTFNQTYNPVSGAVTNTPAITNPEVISELTGSDPTAYANLYPAGYATPGRYDDSTVLFPALPGIGVQKLHSERLGLTASFQMRPSSDTLISIDTLYSHFKNNSDNYGVSPIGLNRDNTSTTLNTLASNASIATKRGVYTSIGAECTPQSPTATTYAIDCGQALYGNTPAFATGSDGKAAVLGTNIFSVNPNNLDTYDYYNNPNSVGYVKDPYGVGGIMQMIGRPSTKVLDDHVTNGVVDYMKLSNVDWRTNEDSSHYVTDFFQTSVEIAHTFSDSFKMDLLGGVSDSRTVSQGYLVEFDSMDQQGQFTWDARGGGNMPVFEPGFNLADPNQWGIVKGFSVMRHYIRNQENTYGNLRADFDWQMNDHNGFLFGVSARKYGFSTIQWQRGNSSSNNTELFIPTEKEAGVSVASLGQVISFGQGLKVPAGTPTSFFAPNLQAFSKVFGFDCNCINKYGDWRLTNNVFSSSTLGGNTFGVDEQDGGLYGEWRFNYPIPTGELSGNFGLREASTDVTANGRDTKNNPVRDTNKYSDTLPSLNLIYQPREDVYIRFAAAKTMARPLLGDLSPSLSALSIPTDGSTSGATVTVGNTRLKPFRSTNYDISAEWYFAKNGLLSLAGFYKKIASFPQVVAYNAPLSNFFNADELATIRAESTNSDYQAYIDNDYAVTARQYRDAPGGFLQGWEFNYQQDFTFLPWKLKNTGMQLNLTHVTSKLTYILDPGSPAVGNSPGTAPKYANGPWLGASPNALNLTLYYETDAIDARISVASRDKYYSTFPLASGSCAPGLNGTSGTAAKSPAVVYCTSPLVTDFSGSQGTTNVDAKITWNYTPHIAFTLEGLNLTNQTTNQFAYVNNPQVTLYSSTGRQITVGVRYRY